MSSTLRFDYDLPWRGVVIGVVFNLGVALIAAHWAKCLEGILSIFPLFLSFAFVFLAIRMIVRRILFPQVLELTDDAILFPGGFFGKRIKRLAFSNILRMGDTVASPGLRLITTKGNFEIMSARFKNMENYESMRTFICSKNMLLGPVLQWSEPEDYIRYRKHLAISKPLWLRLAKAIRFGACVFGFFFIPWLALNYLSSIGQPFISFLSALIPATLFFTLVYWLYSIHPARVGHITVYKNGIHELSGKQTRSFSFGDFIGWQIVEREFQGQLFHIVLLPRAKWVFEVAFPDSGTRDRFIQILNEKKIPELSTLKPSWELKP
jgi:hypothetical protein